MAINKYVPRSIQNIFDRVEAYNESITKKLFSEELEKTFEVIIYASKSPEIKSRPPLTEAEQENSSTSINAYDYFKARSLSGHHDHLIRPETATTVDEYERFRNAHFQAIIKRKSDLPYPLTGEVWLATQSGANLVTLISYERTISLKFNLEKEGPAKDAHNNSTEPTLTNADYGTQQELNALAQKNKASRDILKSQLKVKFEAQGIPFHVTSEVRDTDKQMRLLKKQYNNQGREEILRKYSGVGEEIVRAIESGDDAALRIAAQKSTRHLRGLALDIRSRSMTTEQVNKALDILTNMGLTYILEMKSTDCWDKPGNNVRNVKRLHTPGGPNVGDPCYSEHIHINIPEGYGQ